MIYEITLEDAEDGLFEISLVETPAIERNFHAFSKAKEIKWVQLASEQRVVVGPALIPNVAIPRVAEDGSEYSVIFRKDVIKKLSYKFLQDSKTTAVKLEHGEFVPDVSIVESWIVIDSVRDKARTMGFNVEPGTWMIAMKINNDDIWKNFVKTGLVKGFSVGGQFTLKNKNKKTEMKKELKDALAILSKFAEEVKEETVVEEEKLEGMVTLELPTEIELDPMEGVEMDLTDADGNVYELVIKAKATAEPQTAPESGAPLEEIETLEEEKKKYEEEMSKLKAENESLKSKFNKSTVVKKAVKTSEGGSLTFSLESFLGEKLKAPKVRK